MYSACSTAVLPAVGFPIRKSADQSLFSDSPRLIAAVHVLHRLLVPRHPPCALVLLSSRRTSSREHQLPLCSFQGTRGQLARPPERRPARLHLGGEPAAQLAPAPVSQNSTAWAPPGGDENDPAVCQAFGCRVSIYVPGVPPCRRRWRPRRTGNRGVPSELETLGVVGTACGGASATASLERR